MNGYVAGTDIVACRAVKTSGQFSMTVIPVHPPTKNGSFRGFAQHAVRFPPGGSVRVADEKGDLCCVEAGGPISAGDQLTTDELGRAVVAAPGGCQPVRAYASGSAAGPGEIITAVVAPAGLTT